MFQNAWLLLIGQNSGRNAILATLMFALLCLYWLGSLSFTVMICEERHVKFTSLWLLGAKREVFWVLSWSLSARVVIWINLLLCLGWRWWFSSVLIRRNFRVLRLSIIVLKKWDRIKYYPAGSRLKICYLCWCLISVHIWCWAIIFAFICIEGARLFLDFDWATILMNWCLRCSDRRSEISTIDMSNSTSNVRQSSFIHSDFLVL